MYKKEIKEFLCGMKDDMISDLSALIAIPSVRSDAKDDMPFGKDCADVLSAALAIAEKLGFKTSNCDNYMGSADFSDAEPYLGILTHLDVVPAGDGWKSDPFCAKITDDKIIGRGAIDDKGPMIAALYAMYAVKKLGIPLKRGVRMLFGTDEENGSSDLEYYLKKEKLPPFLFTPDGEYPVINVEKGMLRITFNTNIPDNISITAGTAINAVPAYAKCSLGDEIIETAGTGAHASTPDKGDNALTKLIGVLAERKIEVFEKLAKLFPYGEEDGGSVGVKISDEISGALTLVLSVVSCKDNVMEGKIDIRFPVCTCKQDIIDKLTRKFEENGMKITSAVGVEPHHVPAESEFIQNLLEAYTSVTGKPGYTVAIGGGTYVHETEGGVAFGAEFPGEQNNMHGADEFITIDSLLTNTEIFANAIVKICG